MLCIVLSSPPTSTPLTPPDHRSHTHRRPTPSLVLHSSQSLERNECASCQAVNGILPADGTGCGGHGTHVASTVGGLNYGVAKEVTLVPAFTCFGLLCSDGTNRCGSSSDIRANLEYVPRHPPPQHRPATRPPPHTAHSVPPLSLAALCGHR